MEQLNDLIDRITFPASVAAIIAQIAPVIFLALIIELRLLRRNAPSRDMSKGLRFHLKAAFLGFFITTIGCLLVVGLDGVAGQDAIGMWLVVTFPAIINLITLWHTMKDEP